MTDFAVRRVDQVIPTLALRDAIGQHTIALRDLLRSDGLASDIFYCNAAVDVLKEGRHIDHLGDPDPTGRCLIYQLSTGSPAAAAFARRPEPKVVNYHNITPASLLDPWEPEMAGELRSGAEQLSRLAPLTSLAIADSTFNESELLRAGYRQTTVCPPIVDVLRSTSPNPSLAKRLDEDRRRGGHDLLFVGKIAPHKAQHDLIKALVAYRALYDAKARLRLVGAPLGTSYIDALRRFAERLGIEHSIEFAGTVDDAELAAYYRNADVFVCLSDHEGFCVPLVEAMARGLPIVAYGAGAVGETVADAGLVLDSKDPIFVASAIDRVVRDPSLRTVLAESSARRVLTLGPDRSRACARAAIRGAVSAGSSPNVPGRSTEARRSDLHSER